MAERHSTLVIGVGNPDRGDDAVGPEVARRLRAECLPGVDVVECRGEAFELLELWGGRERVHVVDAVRSGAAPGSVFRINAASEGLPPDQRHSSTHGMGVADSVELAGALGIAPRELRIIGIEGKRWDVGADLSPEVLRAAKTVVARLRRELGAAGV